ncbi:MAG: TIR domain-containing protein, partial [Candidatus Methylophosphatis roskildensis]
MSYRRDDAGKSAWRLFDWFERQFGTARVFFDREGIDPGDKFPQVLEQRLAECEVLIALIGPRWLGISDAQGQLRLWAAQDYVAHEVATALDRNIRVVPVLTDGARMPTREQLPPRLAALADCQGLTIDDAHFREDFDRLVDVIEQRPRRWGERERDRALRLLRYVKRTSVVVPLVVPLVFFAAWVRLFSMWGIDTQIASYTLWLSKGLSPVAGEHRAAIVALDEHTERVLGRAYDGAPFW